MMIRLEQYCSPHENAKLGLYWCSVEHRHHSLNKVQAALNWFAEQGMEIQYQGTVGNTYSITQEQAMLVKLNFGADVD